MQREDERPFPQIETPDQLMDGIKVQLSGVERRNTLKIECRWWLRAGTRTLNLAVNRSVPPVQKWRCEFAFASSVAVRQCPPNEDQRRSGYQVNAFLHGERME